MNEQQPGWDWKKYRTGQHQNVNASSNMRTENCGEILTLPPKLDILSTLHPDVFNIYIYICIDLIIIIKENILY